MKLIQKLKLIAFAFIMFFVAISISGCKTEIVNTWTGFYYPNGDKYDGSTQITSPAYGTLLECKSWAKVQVLPGDKYDYECGKNCVLEDDGETVCEQIIQKEDI